MPPVVEQLELGPIGTNCYLVRRNRDATEAVVVDPSGEPETIVRRLGEVGASCVAILITHGHWDHLVAVADLAEATGAPVHMAENERALLENPAAYAPPTIEIRPHTPEIFLQGGETLQLAGITRRRILRTAPMALSSRAMSCSPARSAEPTCPVRTGRPCSRRSARSSTRTRPRRSSIRATARRRR
jgi:glyoxylase-like metal-dependent hydrolase (beta-lactamase superfamily II)